MRLDLIAQKNLTEVMEGFDEITGTFYPGAFVARIDLTDRFLSNFNKPLRRRMLFSRPGTVFPASGTFRHPGTGDVYLIGQSRQDALGGVPHVQLNVCHLVTEGSSSGLATLYRKAPIGPADDPGWLVDTMVTRCYMDLEFRTSANEADAFEVKVSNFTAHLPENVTCEPWDFLDLHGKRYRVIDVFSDSGFSAARADLEADPRSDFILHTKGPRTYNRATHELESEGRSYNVTGVLANYQDFSAWSTESAPYVDVVIEESHIGVRPVPDSMTLELEGRTRVIKQVSSQPGERQYRLRCE